MQIVDVWLTDFRSHAQAEIHPAPGLTAIIGANGRGKTNLLEAVGYLATLSSFRGAPNEALVRSGSDTAVVRAHVQREGRELLVEVEIPVTGRTRAQVNRQRLNRTRDLLGALRVTVFAPDDLDLVKGGPAARRHYVDDLLVATHPRNDVLRSDLERVIRQRNALLRQAHGRLDADAAVTLDVWDHKLVELGEQLGERRAELVAKLAPELSSSYARVVQGGDAAGPPTEIGISYEPHWREKGLAAAIEDVRGDELRRGVTLVGPHRDEVVLTISGLPARTHASQGEQRSLALAMRLAGHSVVTDIAGVSPVLLLDDVFSELDPHRSHALLANLPAGQTLLTAASGLPAGIEPDMIVDVGTDGLTIRA